MTKMSPHSTLLLIKSDPATDPRPAEAIRSALGLVAGEIPVTIYLFREAHLLLTTAPEDLEDLEDGEVLKRFLHTLFNMSKAIYYEPFENTPPPGLPGSPLSLGDLGTMIPAFDHTLFF
ncbi:MAG: hypothetical protein VST70_02695 [Nitrospirota bacterium]|nr:hypothetical protein [Nitrospirota bacterium]